MNDEQPKLNELQDWQCERCRQSQKFFAAKLQLTLKGDLEKIIAVCAQCHKDLSRAKATHLEFH